MKNLFKCSTFSGLIAMSLSFSILLASCGKDNKVNNSNTTNPEKFRALTKAGYESIRQIRSLDVTGGGVVSFVTDKNTEVKINTSCLRKNGSPVTGNVEVEFYEAYHKNDMIISNKAVVGIKETGGYEPLITGGQYYINITQNGVNLTTECAVLIRSEGDLTGGVDPEMVGWKGYFDGDNLIWKEDTAVLINSQEGSRNYNLNISGFGWFNCDKFLNDPRPKSAITITMPSSYINASNVYAIIKNEPYALGLATYGTWPIGMELHLLFVTEENGGYKWLNKDVTVTNGMTVNFDPTQGTVGNLAAFKAYIATLD